jgi:hypothetical protein
MEGMAARQRWSDVAKKHSAKVVGGGSGHVDPAVQAARDAEKARREAEERTKIVTEKSTTASQDKRDEDARAEERAKRKAEEKAKRKAEEQAAREAEEKAAQEAEERAKRKAEEKAKRKAEEQVAREAEEKAAQEAEDQAKRKAEEKAKRIAEEEAAREAEEQAKREAEETAAREAAEWNKRKAEEKAAQEEKERADEEQALRAAERKAADMADRIAAREAEEQLVREMHERAPRAVEVLTGAPGDEDVEPASRPGNPMAHQEVLLSDESDYDEDFVQASPNTAKPRVRVPSAQVARRAKPAKPRVQVLTGILAGERVTGPPMSFETTDGGLACVKTGVGAPVLVASASTLTSTFAPWKSAAVYPETTRAKALEFLEELNTPITVTVNGKETATTLLKFWRDLYRWPKVTKPHMTVARHLLGIQHGQKMPRDCARLGEAVLALMFNMLSRETVRWLQQKMANATTWTDVYATLPTPKQRKPPKAPPTAGPVDGAMEQSNTDETDEENAAGGQQKAPAVDDEDDELSISVRDAVAPVKPVNGHVEIAKSDRADGIAATDDGEAEDPAEDDEEAADEGEEEENGTGSDDEQSEQSTEEEDDDGYGMDCDDVPKRKLPLGQGARRTRVPVHVPAARKRKRVLVEDDGLALPRKVRITITSGGREQEYVTTVYGNPHVYKGTLTVTPEWMLLRGAKASRV